MNDNAYIGVDNGISGAICLLSPHSKIIDWTDMPIQKARKGNEINVISVRGFLRNMTPDNTVFVIEEPGGSKSAKAAASMAASFGSLRALAVLMGYRLVRVTPQQWQKSILGKTQGDSKELSVSMARQLWPDEDWLTTERCKKPNHNACDAALIAEYARRAGL